MIQKPQWSTPIELLTSRLDEATETVKGNNQEMSLEEHNAYYRTTFDQVREEIASREDIPNAIMETPTKTLTLTFYGAWSKPHCLGCVDFYDDEDIIHVEVYAKEDELGGVTKDDLIRSIGEVLYGGLRAIHRDSRREIGIIPSSFDWMGTTTLCNLVDSILYVGYLPATEILSSEEKKGQSEEGRKRKGHLDIRWEPDALSPGAWGIQGYDIDYSQKLLVVKGWKKEDGDVYLGF